MNILETLNDAYDQHVHDTGCQPKKALYLGARQSRHLAAALAAMPGPRVPQQIAGFPPRSRWRNIPVFRVDSDDYIQFV